MSYNSQPESYITCPYNKYHQILRSRFQFHLMRCKQVYKGDVKLVECPFNSTHLIPEIEMNCHKMYTCPDRNKIETYMVEVEQVTPLFEVKPLEIESSENWDDDTQHTYNPMENCKNKPVLLNIQCAPPSVRKQLRSEERERIANLTSSNPVETLQENRPTSSLRFPHTIPITYFNRNGQDESNGAPGVNNTTTTIPKVFGRGRGRILK